MSNRLGHQFKIIIPLSSITIPTTLIEAKKMKSIKTQVIKKNKMNILKVSLKTIIKFHPRMRSLVKLPNKESLCQNRVDKVILTAGLTNQVSNPKSMSRLQLRNSINCHLNQSILTIQIRNEYNQEKKLLRIQSLTILSCLLVLTKLSKKKQLQLLQNQVRGTVVNPKLSEVAINLGK